MLTLSLIYNMVLSRHEADPTLLYMAQILRRAPSQDVPVLLAALFGERERGKGALERAIDPYFAPSSRLEASLSATLNDADRMWILDTSRLAHQ